MSNCSAAQNQASACCTSASQTDAIETAEGTFGTLLRQLEAACGRDLVFVYDGHPTKPGYHVTEIKFARVTGLDCGAITTREPTRQQTWHYMIRPTQIEAVCEMPRTSLVFPYAGWASIDPRIPFQLP